ncbi:hypothetical protein D3C81_2103630 [compost metagenome]
MLAQGIEELWPALVTDRINEQGKQHCLHARINLHPDLAHHNRNQQRTGDATQLEFAKLELAYVIAQGQRQEQGNLGGFLKQFV